MSEEYDEVEEFDEADDEATDDVDDVVAEDAGDDVDDDVEVVATVAKRKVREEVIDTHSIAARQQLREEMARQVEEFLARGGRIQEVGPTETADPPRKPVSEYGGRSI
ncbi:MAG: hypothetical protein RBS88_07655 [Spongiibacteraceae bacterium]|jgi:hypothetical protein|nr:hypothetical protein [Spongiibacteraceae bacterium]